MLETLDDGLCDEVLHDDRCVTLRVRRQRLVATERTPPIAVERTTLPEGPTRPLVVMVHGFAQNRYTWRLSSCSMTGFLAAAGYDVLNVELRGHGMSRTYGAGNATRFDQYVSDVVRVLQSLDAPAFVIGHSLGAAVCIGAATEVPVRGVVHLAGVYTFARYNRALRAMAKVSRRLEPALKRAPARVKTSWAGSLIGKLYRVTDAAGYGLPVTGWAPGSLPREMLEERLTKGFDWTSVEVWLQMARWADGEAFPYDAAWRALDVPLLVIAGDHDTLVPPDDARACLQASGSTDKHFELFEPFEHRVHWGHIDLCTGTWAPREVWPFVQAFLDAR